MTRHLARRIDALDLPSAVMVTWADHYDLGGGTWVDLDALDEPTGCEVISAGWLVRRSADTLTLCQSITEANDARNVFVILRSTVREVKQL